MSVHDPEPREPADADDGRHRPPTNLAAAGPLWADVGVTSRAAVATVVADGVYVPVLSPCCGSTKTEAREGNTLTCLSCGGAFEHPFPEFYAALRAQGGGQLAPNVFIVREGQRFTDLGWTDKDGVGYAGAGLEVAGAAQWWKNGDHPEDRVGEECPDPAGGTYVRQEGAVVRYYRHLKVPGEQVHDVCGRTMHDHGWIDTPGGGHTVCPGDWVITDVQGERYPRKHPLVRLKSDEPVNLEESSGAAVRRLAGELERLLVGLSERGFYPAADGPLGTAAVDTALGAVDRLRYERRLLGRCRMVLERAADSGHVAPSELENMRAAAADMAQRIVDEIGHPVTDEPALGLEARARLARVERERDEALRDLGSVTDEVNAVRIERDHIQRLAEQRAAELGYVLREYLGHEGKIAVPNLDGRAADDPDEAGGHQAAAELGYVLREYLGLRTIDGHQWFVWAATQRGPQIQLAPALDEPLVDGKHVMHESAPARNGGSVELERLMAGLSQRGFAPPPDTPVNSAAVDTALATVDQLREEADARRADKSDGDQVTRLANFLIDNFPREINGRRSADIAIGVIRQLVAMNAGTAAGVDPLNGLREQAGKFREQRDQAERDLAETRADHQRACEQIAAMYEAGTGRVGQGPVRGVVEDLADEHQRRLAAEEALGLSFRRTEALERELRRCRAGQDLGKLGDRVMNGGVMGTLVRCGMCGGGGLLHRPDELPETAAPQPEPREAEGSKVGQLTPPPVSDGPMTASFTGAVSGPVRLLDGATGETLADVPTDGTVVPVPALPGKNVTFLGGVFHEQMRRVPLLSGSLPRGLVCEAAPGGGRYALVHLSDEEGSLLPVYVEAGYQGRIELAQVPDPVLASQIARVWDTRNPGCGIHPRRSAFQQRLEFTLRPRG